jgi:hypothetical protein
MTHTPWKSVFVPQINGFQVWTANGEIVIADIIPEEKDARLIAAAPALYKALKAMVAYFGVDIEGFDESDPKFIAFDNANAALALVNLPENDASAA